MPFCSKYGDESILVDSENEDSDIDLDFIDRSEDEGERLCLTSSVAIFTCSHVKHR